MSSRLSRVVLAHALGVLLVLGACRGSSAPPDAAPVEELPTALDGDPASRAHDAIPDLRYDPRAATFLEWPSSPGMPVTVDTVVVALASETTVAEANALLAELGAGIAGGLPPPAPGLDGLLVLRLPSATFDERDALVARAEASGVVVLVAPDAALELRRTTRPDPASSVWSWERQPMGGNWGFEALRVPQAWNIAGKLPADRKVAVGMIDGGAMSNWMSPESDLTYTDVGDCHPDGHGATVAGIIGATFDNGHHVDGVSPAAALHCRLVGVSALPETCPDGTCTPDAGESCVSCASDCGACTATCGDGVVDAGETCTTCPDDTGRCIDSFTAYNASFIYADLQALGELAGTYAPGSHVRVVNYSAGYDFPGVNNPRDPATAPYVTAPAYEELIADHGALLALVLDNLADAGRETMFVCAAGNEGRSIDGRYTSACCHLAATSSAAGSPEPHVLCVEALSPTMMTWSDSNIGGQLSAPGDDVTSLSFRPESTSSSSSGTSFATPFVVGQVSWLMTVDPTLTAAEVRTLLTHPDVLRPLADGGAGYADTFDATLAIDTLRGNQNVLRMLLDVDDGTLDGNTRIDTSGAVVGLPASEGDGVIDMSDFRVLRDAMAQARGAALDGPAAHPKNDLNGDSVVGSRAAENVYPRADFNGDGAVWPNAARMVRGSIQDEVTDVGVLVASGLFSDLDVDVTELPALVDSVDLHAHVGACTSLPGVSTVEAYVLTSGGVEIARRTVTSEAIFTVPSAPYFELYIDAKDASGEVLHRTWAEGVGLGLGADLHAVGCADFGVVGCTNEQAYNGFSLPCHTDSNLSASWPSDPVSVLANGRSFLEVSRDDATTHGHGVARINGDGLCFEAEASSVGSNNSYDVGRVVLQAIVTKDMFPSGMLPPVLTIGGDLMYGGSFDPAAILDIEVYDLTGTLIGRASKLASSTYDPYGWVLPGSQPHWTLPMGEVGSFPIVAPGASGISIWALVTTHATVGTASATLRLEYGTGACGP